MAIDLTARIAHDPENPDMKKVLEKLQGNILRGHGRKNTRNLFLRFTSDAANVRARLIPFLFQIVTPASSQQADPKDPADPPKERGLFANFFLSADGYRKLGFSNGQIRDFLPEPPAGPTVRSSFLEGMKAHYDELHDPKPSAWDQGFQSTIDALILLAHDDEDKLNDSEQVVRTHLAGVAVVVATEPGQAMRNPAGQGVEHFGYADGRSQPVFFQSQLAREGPSETWNPIEPLNLVLVKDRVVNDENAFGSFYVFRKLEQNDRDFRIRERTLADALQIQGADRQRVGAMAVGRFRDGTPIVSDSRAKGTDPIANDFRFGNAWDKCPFHAHIRKVNPRGDLAQIIAQREEDVERNRRIVRRGIPYGKRTKPPWEEQTDQERPSTGVGLLFACFQASIANQFAFMQARWINRTDFPDGADSGIDPLVGKPQAGPSDRWNLAWGEQENLKMDFGQFVTLKGGEFFFAPSLPFLTVLAPPA